MRQERLPESPSPFRYHLPHVRQERNESHRGDQATPQRMHNAGERMRRFARSTLSILSNVKR